MAFRFGGIYPLNKQHLFIPEGFNRLCPAFIHVDGKQMEEAFLDPEMVDDQTTAFHMKYLHRCTLFIDKNISISAADIHTHLACHNTTQNVKLFRISHGYGYK
ncbi:hypothetical protein GGR06_003091 [Bacteroides reticulotermitis]|uniref:Uncharacterized protein n=2 Tax=Bacteroides reticulotermitis TaxID=1133319 RepID=W4UUP7_9BACE|nr:hypothetical protein [Bacteroides reticulotermitis]GAE84244.1 hypothetical protein JCM10512_2576 [Bacteroides reticulotermitis JCM 10512]